jgi:hypothetical protein
LQGAGPRAGDSEGLFTRPAFLDSNHARTLAFRSPFDVGVHRSPVRPCQHLAETDMRVCIGKDDAYIGLEFPKRPRAH